LVCLKGSHGSKPKKYWSKTRGVLEYWSVGVMEKAFWIYRDGLIAPL
jgi:hypothetical protein